MTACRSLLLAFLAALVAGCATPVETRHFLLVPVETATAGGRQPELLVGPVLLPDYLLRTELARRVGEQGLQYSRGRRWAEPLDSGIQRVTMANLGAVLDTTRVERFPGPVPRRGAYRVALTVHRFEAEGQAVVAAIDWQLLRGISGDILEEGAFSRRRAVAGDDATAVAAGLSELLGALAREIGAAVPAD
ncbi:MAG TPA: PqiC family protein [Pseudohaliea sp.]|nr:PqiC family protein [Pseudohaliea sp.]